MLTESPLQSGAHGWFGKSLVIDAADGSSRTEAIEPELCRRFIGGVGLGTWICANEGGPAHDPLAPEAPLILCLSPLVGTPLTTSAKFAVVARSPLTGYLCDAISSSHFAIAAKRAGYDAYAIVGTEPIEVVGDGLHGWPAAAGADVIDVDDQQEAATGWGRRIAGRCGNGLR